MDNTQVYTAGIDVGSTTTKIVILDEHDNLIFSDYRRHHAAQEASVIRAFSAAQEALGDAKLRVILTGSGAKPIAEALEADFVQEVVANAVALKREFPGVRTAIESKAAADQLAMCQQTYTLTDTMNRGILALDNKIDALESNRKDREITALTAQVAKLESQNFTAGIVQQAVAPVNSALAALAREVDDIKCKQPSTVSVQYPNLVAVNATPYVSGGFYQGGYGNGAYYGPGWGYGNNGLVF